MPSYRVQRMAEDVKRELTAIMRTLKDPRIGGLISIVKLDLASDYSYCKVYVSSLDGLEGAKSAVEGLTSASGFIHRELRARLKMRRTPEFQFIADNGIERSAELNRLMDDLK